MRRRPSWGVCFLLVSFLVGCVAVPKPDDSKVSEPPRPPGAQVTIVPNDQALSPLLFTEPVTMGPDIYGYEPAIGVAPDGVIYASAHKSDPVLEGTRTASWAWYSIDQGKSWQEMPSPLGQYRQYPGIENDLTVGPDGSVYVVDAYLGESSVARWRSTPQGPIWEYGSPLQRTTESDDRPWLVSPAAKTVYLLELDPALLGADSTGGSTTPEGAVFFHSSFDGGETWSAGHLFPKSRFCHIGASTADPARLVVGCNLYDDPIRIGLFTSDDSGRTWALQDVDAFGIGEGDKFPATAMDAGGNAYHAYADDDYEGDKAGQMRIARCIGGGNWTILNMTPFEGTFGNLRLAAGSAGTVALTFHATKEIQVTSASEWLPYVLYSVDADQEVSHWVVSPLAAEPSSVGYRGTGSYFAATFDAEDRLHVILQRVVPRAIPKAVDYPNELIYLRQAAQEVV